MRFTFALAVLLSVKLVSARPFPGEGDVSQVSKDYPIQPVSFTAVHVNDQFWAPRIETNREVSIPTAFEQCERTGRVGNFERAAQMLRTGSLEDKHAPGYPFDDTDIYKVVEGASYALSVSPDPKLEAYVDGLIAKVAAAQEPDGYIYTARTINPQHPHPWAGSKRWEKEEVNSHELYDLGHLYEAAVAYYQATGKRTLLDVAIKSANLLVNTFGPGKRKIYPGHQIAEMGLVKLYRVTGNQQYLELAKFMLDSRGPGGDSYNQANIRVVEQGEAEGHAVRAGYMYTGMADVAALTGDTSYLQAIDRIWGNVVTKKIYVTGGIGAIPEIEGFGADYELPNMSAYNETCAAIANVFWNQRLFLLHGDAKYIDVLERTLYNGLLSGVSLDGKTYFYPNPLESNGQHRRSPWFGVACCPGNITRFMPSLPGYVYAMTGNVLYVNLFAANTAEVKLGNGERVRLTQQTRYPWEGDIRMKVEPNQPALFTLKIRIPGWARGEAIPGDLYRFAAARTPEQIQLMVNGKGTRYKLEKGYATIERKWQAGDTVELRLPMDARRIIANSKVAADQGRVALQRGPLVYCAEWPDSPDKHVRNLMLKDTTLLQAEWKPKLLNGIDVLKGEADAFRITANGDLQKTEESFTAIPYYAWANRGPGQMEVWIPNQQSAVHPTPAPSLASTSRVTTSGSDIAANGVRDPRLVADQEEPQSSNDRSSYYDWLPKKGTTEWIQYDFPGVSSVSSVDVYWFVEPAKGGNVKLPLSWRILYKDGAEWKPVVNLGPYETAENKYSRVNFEPIKTSSMRLEVHMQPNAAAGVSEWRVK